MLPVCNRCLLVKDGERLIMIDTGIGDKQQGKFRDYLYLFGDDSLQKSLSKAGLSFEQVTDVLLTHLHYDHCGGGVKYNAGHDGFELVFPNARYWCSKAQWEWAVKPNAREAASYFKENLLPMMDSGRLNLIEKEGRFSDSIEIMFVNGHTDGQIVPLIRHRGRTVAFMADFIPSVNHIPLPYVPSYDTRPLLSMKEKETYLSRALTEKHILFFEHDYHNEACTVVMTEKGIRLDRNGTLAELMNPQL
jgi:glyoxylase-like metal-dependent hydrolase (beta-lactamase superfamily II)